MKKIAKIAVRQHLPPKLYYDRMHELAGLYQCYSEKKPLTIFEKKQEVGAGRYRTVGTVPY